MFSVSQAEGDVYGLVGSQMPTLPSSIAGAVRQRLGRLPPETLELLRTAAIVGRTFDLGLLAEAAGQEPEAVEECLQPAVCTRLIFQSDSGAYTNDECGRSGTVDA